MTAKQDHIVGSLSKYEYMLRGRSKQLNGCLLQPLPEVDMEIRYRIWEAISWQEDSSCVLMLGRAMILG